MITQEKLKEALSYNPSAYVKAKRKLHPSGTL